LKKRIGAFSWSVFHFHVVAAAMIAEGGTSRIGIAFVLARD